MPYVVMIPMPGASWMMFPTKNYSSCQAMEEVGTGPITERRVRAPEASWKSSGLLKQWGRGKGWEEVGHAPCNKGPLDPEPGEEGSQGGCSPSGE